MILDIYEWGNFDFRDNIAIFSISSMVETWAQRVDSEGNGLPSWVNKGLSLDYYLLFK